MDNNNENNTQDIPPPNTRQGRRIRKNRPPVRQSEDYKRAKILELTCKSVNVQDIAEIVAMPVDTIKSILERFEPVFKELKNVPDYRQAKSELLSAGQLAALKSAFDGNKLEKAGFLSTLQGFEILNKAERLENNQSTENHAHLHGKLSLKKD